MNNKSNPTRSEVINDIIDLVAPIWKSRILVLVVTIAVALLFCLYNFLTSRTAYTTRFNMAVNMPKSYITKYGEYVLPVMSNEQYANLIKSRYVIKNTINDLKANHDIELDDLSDRIQVTSQQTGNDQTVFEVKVTFDRPEYSSIIAEYLYSNLIEYVDVITREKALAYFQDRFIVSKESAELSLQSEEASLKINEALLAETPEFINFDGIKNSFAVGEYVIIDRIINPAYERLQNDIITNKQNINNLKKSISNCDINLTDIKAEQEAVKEYYVTGEPAATRSKITNITDANFYLLSPIDAESKSAPQFVKTIVFGVALGLVIGVGIAMLKHWFTR